jgi:dTDP-4-amino-4,6-dideoxygalactose transaminase
MQMEINQAPVPLCDLQALRAPLANEIRSAIDRVAESQHFIMGPEIRELEEQVASYSGVTHAVSCSSGTDVLLLD